MSPQLMAQSSTSKRRRSSVHEQQSCKRRHRRVEEGDQDDDGDTIAKLDVSPSEPPESPGSPPISVPHDPPKSPSTTNSPSRRRIFLNRPHLPIPNRKFSIIAALSNHPDILMILVRYLPPRTIVNLYSISAPFQYQFNSHYTQFILSAISLHAPKSDWLFPWNCYAHLCITDPGHRLPSTYNPSHYGENEPRPIKTIPSLRWLRMVTFRHLVAKEIQAHLLVAGFPTPAYTHTTLLKTWFLLDIPISSVRIALMQNRTYFPNKDLPHILGFCMKLDMYFTDPINFTGGEVMMRKYLLAEPSLSTLWNWLRGAEGGKRIDCLRLWVKHEFNAPVRGPFPESEEVQRSWEAVDRMGIMGVPVRLCGRAGKELHGRGGRRLLRPDELVVKESVRRGLKMESHLIKMMRWGYLDRNLKKTREFSAEEVVPTLMLRREKQRRIAREAEVAEEKRLSDAMEMMKLQPDLD